MFSCRIGRSAHISEIHEIQQIMKLENLLGKPVGELGVFPGCAFSSLLFHQVLATSLQKDSLCSEITYKAQSTVNKRVHRIKGRKCKQDLFEESTIVKLPFLLPVKLLNENIV